MKKIVFATSDIDNEKFMYPFKHASISPKKRTRPMFIPDYHAPLDRVYADNGYNVVHKTVKQAWMDSDVEPFIYTITPQPNIFALYKQEQEKTRQYFQSINPLVIDAVNEGRCVSLYIIAKNSMMAMQTSNSNCTIFSNNVDLLIQPKSL